MADNIYTGPGWYWIEGRDNPVEVRTNPMFGILEMWEGGAWVFWIDGKPIKPIARIEKPEPRPTMDWSVLPAWAKWIAYDGRDGWCWYTHEPRLDEKLWKCDSGTYHYVPREYAPKWNGDWRNSLVEVPR